MARRSRTDAALTRRTILLAARDLFIRCGYASTRIADIVERAGVTKGAFFHHFDNKEAVFREIWVGLQKDMDDAARKASIAARSRTDPYAAFLAGCKTYLEWAQRPDYQKIVLIDGPVILGLAGWYEADDGLGRQNAHAGIEYLARKGIIDPQRVDAYAVMIHNALNGAGFALARGDKGITAQTLLHAFEHMLKGLS